MIQTVCSIIFWCFLSLFAYFQGMGGGGGGVNKNKRKNREDCFKERQFSPRKGSELVVSKYNTIHAHTCIYSTSAAAAAAAIDTTTTAATATTTTTTTTTITSTTTISTIINIIIVIIISSSFHSRFSQCSTTGVTKSVVCAIISVGWCL